QLWSCWFALPRKTSVSVLYSLSLHDALPILVVDEYGSFEGIVTLTDILEAITGEVSDNGEDEDYDAVQRPDGSWLLDGRLSIDRSEEHTSELQSRENLVCRLLLEKKKDTIIR